MLGGDVLPGRDKGATAAAKAMQRTTTGPAGRVR